MYPKSPSRPSQKYTAFHDESSAQEVSRYLCRPDLHRELNRAAVQLYSYQRHTIKLIRARLVWDICVAYSETWYVGRLGELSSQPNPPHTHSCGGVELITELILYFATNHRFISQDDSISDPMSMLTLHDTQGYAFHCINKTKSPVLQNCRLCLPPDTKVPFPDTFPRRSESLTR